MLDIRPCASANHVQNSTSAEMFTLSLYSTVFTWTEYAFYTNLLMVNDTFKFNSKKGFWILTTVAEKNHFR